MYFISKKRKLLESEKLQRFLIRLDKKGRLVLPLEIRDAINIKPGDKILLSEIAVEGGKVAIRVAKALEGIESCAYSRNGAYVKANKKRGEKYE